MKFKIVPFAGWQVGLGCWNFELFVPIAIGIGICVVDFVPCNVLKIARGYVGIVMDA